MGSGIVPAAWLNDAGEPNGCRRRRRRVGGGTHQVTEGARGMFFGVRVQRRVLRFRTACRAYGCATTGRAVLRRLLRLAHPRHERAARRQHVEREQRDSDRVAAYGAVSEHGLAT